MIIYSAQEYQKRKKMYLIGYISLVASFIGLWLLLNPILFANSFIFVKKIDRMISGDKGKAPKKVITVASQPIPTPKPIDPATLPFSLYIDKIDLEATVVPNVDATDSEAYKTALKQGVAHAKGTAFPGQDKMIYIFGHSTDYSWNVTTYNALFYQVKDLEKGDLVQTKLGETVYDYKVVDKVIVAADDMSLIDKHFNDNVLILQTCYPPGTTWKRLLVVATPKSSFYGLISYKR